MGDKDVVPFSVLNLAVAHDLQRVVGPGADQVHPDVSTIQVQVPAPEFVAVVHLRQGGAIAFGPDPGPEGERVGPVEVGVVAELDVVFTVEPEGLAELAVYPVAASLDGSLAAGVNRVGGGVALAFVE